MSTLNPAMAELAGEWISWVEDVTGGVVGAVTPLPAGGRRGFFVDVTTGTDERHLFLQFGRGKQRSVPTLFHGVDVEASVLRALEPLGIPVPHVWALDETRDAVLVDRAPGEVWFQPPRDPAIAESVAKDFITHLARWHRADPRELELPFGPVRRLHQHLDDQLDGVAWLMGTVDAPDPLVTFSLEWLRTHQPDADAPVVLVQGDTGPGNFLHAGGRVTAVIDWELSHLGDPMDDIAWLTWRVTQHTFPDLPARLREYEHLSGIEIDARRVAYYRLNAFGRLGPTFGIADMGESTRALGTGQRADGSDVIMSMLHRRMRLEATALALDLPIPPREVDEAPASERAPLYDRVLEQVQAMVSRVDDRSTAGIGKSIARQIKYLKELDRNGDLFAAAELDDINEVLGARHRALDAARPALLAAARDRDVGIQAYLDYHWRRLRRDDHLMRAASGALFDRSWPSLR